MIFLIALAFNSAVFCLGTQTIFLFNNGALITVKKRQTNLQLSCDSVCVNGKCNPTTKSCVCNEGWSGAACDVCSIGKICDWSISRPAISIILPQTGPVVSSTSQDASFVHTDFVFAHGRGFPRGRDARYNCLFGGVATEGRWLSNSVVRCIQPPRAHVGKHAFNLVPLGTNTYIPYEVGTMHHYTFYLECDSSLCQGNCLGPLCLCRLHSQIGQRCEISNLETVTNSTVVEDSPAITHAQELQPYTAKIPVQSPSSHLTILYTDIDQLSIDPFENTVKWDQPVGNTQPYHISIQVLGTSSRNVLNWTLSVEPSYMPVVENVTLSDTGATNNRVVFGEILLRNDSSSNKSILLVKKLPIILKVYLDSYTKLVETVQTFSLADEEHTFQYELFPYIGMPGRYSITAQHPSTDDTDNNFVEWIEDELKIKALQAEIVINERNFTESYRILAESKALCGKNGVEWMVEVIEPRKVISISSFNKSSDLHIDVTFSIFPSSTKSMGPNTLLQLVFNCGFQTASTIQTLHFSKPIVSVFSLNPERIFISTVSARDEQSLPPQPTVTIDVEIEHLDENSFAPLSDTNFSPFRLVWGDVEKLREVGKTVRLWLALKAQWDDSFSADSAIYIPNSQNPVISIPYLIRRKASETIAFVLTLKCYSDLTEDNPNSLVDVELFSTNKEQSFTKSIHLNVATSFYPLKTDFFQLKVKSTEFIAFQTVIKITTDNNNLTIGLNRRASQYFVSDGREISVENDKNQARYRSPSLSLHPSVFPIAQYAEDVFVNMAYEKGPLNSFLSIKHVGIDEPYLLTINNNSTIPTLCCGCGHRLPVRIHQNAYSLKSAKEEEGCNFYPIPITFSYTIPGLQQTFFSKTFAVIDGRKDSFTSKPFMCGNDIELAQKTSLVISCATEKLKECRRLYFSHHASIPMCDSQWDNIPDDLLSIHTYAQYLLLATRCQMFGVDLGLIRHMIRCISTMDFDCPTSEPNVEKSTALIDPGLFAGQLFNQQFGLVQPVKVGVQSMFPALSAVDAQLANFPAVLQDFLEQLEKVFPSSDLNTLLADEGDIWLDKFLEAVSDQSKGGALVISEELEDFEDWEKGAGLIARWNETFEDLQGSNVNLQFPELKTRIGDFRQLVSRADRLKSITRQFGGENPFSMLHDVLKKMFANLGADDGANEKLIGSAVVRIQPAEISEGEEFRIFVSVHNLMVKELLRNIHLNVDFGKEFFGGNRNGLKYRVGPVFYSGIASIDSANQLKANDKLTAEWTVLPVPDYRLTRTVTQTPQIILSFDLAGQRKIQRLRSPVFAILPRASVRVLAFAFPTVHRENWQQQGEEDGSVRPFTVTIAVINSGYSNLNKVEIVEIQPWLVVAHNRSSLITVDYKFSGVQLDGSDFSDTSGHLNAGPIVSSQSRHLTLNISTLKETEAIFRNLSLLVLANDQVVTQFDYRFFLIHDTIDVRHTSFLVSESSQPFPLHYYSKQTGKLVPLHSLQPIEEKKIIQQINGHSYVSILVAYRKLTMNTANIPTSLTSAVFGTFRVNSLSEFKKNEVFELVRASEVLARNGVQQRPLVPQQLWMDKRANSTVVKFVDLEAVGQGSSSQIFYEFLFGDPEHFKLPYFPRSFYRIQIVRGGFYSESPNGDPIVISSLKAVSPIGDRFNYSLVSRKPDSHFEVVPQTGEIVLTDPLNKTIEPEALCMNLIAEDSHNHKTIVPVQFSTSVQKSDKLVKEECSIFPSSEESTLYPHTFNGDTDSLVRNSASILMPVSEVTSTPTTLLPTMPADPTLPVVAITTETRLSLATGVIPTLWSLPPSFTASPIPKTTFLKPTTTRPTSYSTFSFSIPEAEEDEKGVENHNMSPNHNLQTALTTNVERIPSTVLTVNPDHTLPTVSTTSKNTATTTIKTPAPTFPVITTNPLAILPWLWTPKAIVAVQPASTMRMTTPTTPKRIVTVTATPQQLPSIKPIVVSTHTVTPSTFSRASASPSAQTGVFSTVTPANVPLMEDVGPSEDMIEMACRQRQLKPIWAVICDLGKTVYKTRD